MIKTLLFDNDGVLVDTEKYFYEATKTVLGGYGIEFTREKYIELTLIGNAGGWQLAREKGYVEEDVNRMRDERDKLYGGYLAGKNLILDGVEETLKETAKKYKLGVVTSSKKSHFDLIHNNAGIAGYFDFILTREDYSKSKPSPEPYLKALEVAGCSAGECVVIEDSHRGLISASDAGIKCVIVPNDLTRSCDFSKAWKVLDNISELLWIL